MDFVKTRSLSKGEKLFHEKDTSTDVFFLRVGTLLVLKGEILIGQVKPPTFVGEMGPVLNMPRATTIIAKTAASLDVYDGREMMAKLTIQNEMGTKFLRSLSERFEMVRDRVSEYQYQYLMECMKILAILISEKKIVDKKLEFTDIKNIRREVELMLGQSMARKDAVEDCAVLHKMAKQHGVSDKFEQSISARFRTFELIDLKPFKLPRSDSFLDFRSGAQSIAEKIVILTRCLTEFQNLGLSRLESEITLIEETMPFPAREQILKELMLSVYAKGSLDDFKRQVTEFDRAVKSLVEETGHTDMPLGPIAKKFNLDEPYFKSLQTKWKEFLMK